jgi:hypothetical protein
VDPVLSAVSLDVVDTLSSISGTFFDRTVTIGGSISGTFFGRTKRIEVSADLFALLDLLCLPSCCIGRGSRRSGFLVTEI